MNDVAILRALEQLNMSQVAEFRFACGELADDLHDVEHLEAVFRSLSLIGYDEDCAAFSTAVNACTGPEVPFVLALAGRAVRQAQTEPVRALWAAISSHAAAIARARRIDGLGDEGSPE